MREVAVNLFQNISDRNASGQLHGPLKSESSLLGRIEKCSGLLHSQKQNHKNADEIGQGTVR